MDVDENIWTHSFSNKSVENVFIIIGYCSSVDSFRIMIREMTRADV